MSTKGVVIMPGKQAKFVTPQMQQRMLPEHQARHSPPVIG
jgi:hypothetical protein